MYFVAVSGQIEKKNCLFEILNETVLNNLFRIK